MTNGKIPACAVVGYALTIGDPVAFDEELNSNHPYKSTTPGRPPTPAWTPVAPPFRCHSMVGV